MVEEIGFNKTYDWKEVEDACEALALDVDACAYESNLKNVFALIAIGKSASQAIVEFSKGVIVVEDEKFIEQIWGGEFFYNRPAVYSWNDKVTLDTQQIKFRMLHAFSLINAKRHNGYIFSVMEHDIQHLYAGQHDEVDLLKPKLGGWSGAFRKAKRDQIFARILCYSVAYVYCNVNSLSFEKRIETLYENRMKTLPARLDKSLSKTFFSRLRDEEFFRINPLSELKDIKSNDFVADVIRILSKCVSSELVACCLLPSEGMELCMKQICEECPLAITKSVKLEFEHAGKNFEQKLLNAWIISGTKK